MPETALSGTHQKRLAFGRERDLVELPDLIEVQRDSYQWFFQFNREPGMRKSMGLQELFEEVFPIESYDGSFALKFVQYFVESPNTSEEEARRRDLTWSMPVKATIQLENRKTGEIKEEDIFVGDFPVMTEKGTYIINGTERVVVNQLARSAGVYYTADDCHPGA